jgi:hypothetical protein
MSSANPIDLIIEHINPERIASASGKTSCADSAKEENRTLIVVIVLLIVIALLVVIGMKKESEQLKPKKRRKPIKRGEEKLSDYFDFNKVHFSQEKINSAWSNSQHHAEKV